MDWTSRYRYYLFSEQSPILSLRSCTPVRKRRKKTPILSSSRPISLSTTFSLSFSLSLPASSSREISGSLTPENESFPGKYFFFFVNTFRVGNLSSRSSPRFEIREKKRRGRFLVEISVGTKRKSKPYAERSESSVNEGLSYSKDTPRREITDAVIKVMLHSRSRRG